MDFDLTLIWAIILATAIFMYVVMDGFDLGLGILFPALPEKPDRDIMVNTIAPFWDGNETWLILGGGGLLAVFPLAYAIIMPALYMPVILMVLSLIFRGVSFEMRFRAETKFHQLLWDCAFSWGSYAAAFCQGIMLGALVQGIKVEGRHYAGGWWDWLTPFSVFTGLAVIAGYGLLGACWLIWKTEGQLQDRARTLAGILAIATLVCIGLVSLAMLILQPGFRHRWLSVPNLFYAAPVPLLVMLATLGFYAALRTIHHRRSEPYPADARPMWRDAGPFLYALGFFLLSYIGLGISLYPLIVPPDITLSAAAGSPASQRFLLIGAVVMVPMILGYTAYVYWLFRGKVGEDNGYH